jgi:AcrR family transcriptional regulator
MGRAESARFPILADAVIVNAEPGSEQGRLRAAALDLACRHGYARVTVDALLERSGLCREAFERHYADAEDCLIDVYRVAFEQLYERGRDAVECQSGWRNQLRAFSVATIDFLREDRLRARFLIVEVGPGGERLRVAREADLAKLCELIEPEPEETGAASGPLKPTDSLVGGVFMHLYRTIQRDRLDSAYDGIPEMLYSFVLPYLGEQAALEELHRPVPTPGEWRTPYEEAETPEAAT